MWKVAAKLRNSCGRHAPWWAAAALASLLVLPAEPVTAESPRREGAQEKATANKSSGSSGSSKASASRPRASSQSRPKASRPSRSEARSRPQASPRTHSRSDRAMSQERSRPRRAPAAIDRPAPRRGSTLERGGPGIDGAPPNLRQRREVRHPEDAGYGPRTEGRSPGAVSHHRPRSPRYGSGGYHHHHHRHYYGCGHYGYGFYPYDRWGFGFFSPYSYWGLGYYGGHAYYAPDVDVYVSGGGYSGGGSDLGEGALDLDVRPSKAEVFVDGNYVGVADQYDGYPGYLWLEEGTYELAFYKEGYETVFLQYTIYPGVTIDVDVRLRRGKSVYPGGPSGPAGPIPGSASGGDPGLPEGVDVGRIAVAATPGDAAVYLDGHFVGTAQEISELDAGLLVTPGDHLVEIIRPGYEPASVPISVTVGERIDLALDLEKR